MKLNVYKIKILSEICIVIIKFFLIMVYIKVTLLIDIITKTKLD